MESNPDEFILNNIRTVSKWADIIIGIRTRMQKMASKSIELYTIDELSYLTDEEVLALDAKLKDIRRDAFTKNVMSTILADADDGNYHSFDQPIGTAPNSYQTSNPPKTLVASHEQVKAMKAYMKAEAEKEQLKSHIELHKTMLTQANLADAIQNINTKRAFGKGK